MEEKDNEVEFMLQEPQKPQKICIVVVGPTASGKSALAIELCQKFNLEIINADAIQLYKGI